MLNKSTLNTAIDFNEIYEECPDNRVIQYIGIYLNEKYI